jgi:hypothetical protein
VRSSALEVRQARLDHHLCNRVREGCIALKIDGDDAQPMEGKFDHCADVSSLCRAPLGNRLSNSDLVTGHDRN